MQAILIFAQDDGATIPRGSHGGRLHIRYRLMAGTTPVPNAAITERFTAVEDPYGLVPQIRTGTYRTAARGDFDDRVGFSTPDPLPDDFRLVADQEILANGQTAATNRVTWSSAMVIVRATDGRRPPTVMAQVQLR
ncbi:MAG TPA: hypothetical protein VFA33_22265 [Bryobacteraceae bacterium]|nr:hypothetical protein [Bryobacteraceae bacterium]